MGVQKYSREDAIEVRAFLQLFIGALRIEYRAQRLRTILILLLAGRLGLRASEIQHLHEGWIDWEQGIIRVPSHDPCFCKWCLNSARKKVAHKNEVEPSELSFTNEDVLKYAYENQYEPKPNASARVVPFGWSKRITAYLLIYFRENDYISITQQQMRNDIRKAARNTEDVNPEHLTPHPLRATGATFFADAGLLAKPLRDLLGHSDRSEGRRYIRASGRQLTHKIYKLMDREEWAPDIVPEDPENKFPVVRDPRPFAAETDVDSREYGPRKRIERANELEEEEDVLYNPRREKRRDGVPYKPNRHTIPNHIDPDGPGFEDPVDQRDPEQMGLEDVVKELNTQSELDQGNRRDGLSDIVDNTGQAAVVAMGKIGYVVALTAVSAVLTLGA